MKEELVFYERQRFTQWWLFVLLISVNILFLYGCIMQIGLGESFGNKPMSDVKLMVITAITMLITVSFFFIRLDTVINKEGVYFRMFPFHPRFKFIPWDNISQVDVRKINPIGELGGWGIRFKLFNFGGSGISFGINTQSYTLSGNKVLKLSLINNKSIYIGTQMPDELSEFLFKLDAERKQKQK